MDWNLFWTAFGASGGIFGAMATVVVVSYSCFVVNPIWIPQKLKLRFTDNF